MMVELLCLIFRTLLFFIGAICADKNQQTPDTQSVTRNTSFAAILDGAGQASDGAGRGMNGAGQASDGAGQASDGAGRGMNGAGWGSDGAG